jgi:hypothetical protein
MVTFFAGPSGPSWTSLGSDNQYFVGPERPSERKYRYGILHIRWIVMEQNHFFFRKKVVVVRKK